MKIKILVAKPNYLIYYVRYAGLPTRDAIKFYGVFFCDNQTLYSQKQIFIGEPIDTWSKFFEEWEINES